MMIVPGSRSRVVATQQVGAAPIQVAVGLPPTSGRRGAENVTNANTAPRDARHAAGLRRALTGPPRGDRSEQQRERAGGSGDAGMGEYRQETAEVESMRMK
jgi:hypothetical protein